MPVDPAATDVEIAAVAVRLGLDRRHSGVPHGATPSRIRQSLPHGRSNVVTVEIKRSIWPNHSATSRLRRGRGYERALAVGAEVRESQHKVDPAIERDDAENERTG